ncbi:MAG TPA: hypothetical protein PKH10_04485, partial [bacterium]|nr:hypothetical protein [bacterium]
MFRPFVGSLLLAALTFLFGGCGLINAITTSTHESETISVATVWEHDHVISGTLTVNAPLTIRACANIKMENGGSIVVRDNGSIIAIGSADCDTRFTSSKTIPAAGDWDAIYIYNTASAGNAFEKVTFEYGGGTYGVLWVEDNASVRVDASTFAHIKSTAVMIEDGATIGSFVGNSFKSIGGNPVWTSGNIVPSLSPVLTTDLTAAVNRIHIDGTTVTE